MVILGFMIHHMLRLNISITIVEMVTMNKSNASLVSYGPRYNWNEEEKNDILGYFFCGFILTQVPGGRLSEMYGTRIVVGVGLLCAALATILVPLACHMHYYWVLFARFALGLALGVQWPSIPPMAAKWVSPSDTSKFMSHMTASALGGALTYPVCGYLITSLGWPSVFYISGGITLLWTMAWFYLVYDSPEQHPRISREEKEQLINARIVNCAANKSTTPWINIFISPPAWAFIMGNVLFCFTTYLALYQLPSYISQVLHLNIEQNGWLSSLPHFGKYAAAVISSYLADRALKAKKFSRTTVRKVCTTISFWGPSILFTIQAIWGDNYTVSVVVFVSAFAFMSFATPGVLANCVDIAPAYSGTILGISQVLAGAGGYVSTKIVGLITKEEQSFQQWRYIFWIAVGVNMVAGAIFLMFASGEVQSWNSSDRKPLEEVEREQNVPLTG
ncbi:hypothetical protein MTP99_011170 [Tenebrio molitor]|nr:hypothetical protein MTP99_011170 [Tenebrio molitor]